MSERNNDDDESSIESNNSRSNMNRKRGGNEYSQQGGRNHIKQNPTGSIATGRLRNNDAPVITELESNKEEDIDNYIKYSMVNGIMATDDKILVTIRMYVKDYIFPHLKFITREEELNNFSVGSIAHTVMNGLMISENDHHSWWHENKYKVNDAIKQHHANVMSEMKSTYKGKKNKNNIVWVELIYILTLQHYIITQI